MGQGLRIKRTLIYAWRLGDILESLVGSHSWTALDTECSFSSKVTTRFLCSQDRMNVN